jgi:hypothetical protein
MFGTILLIVVVLMLLGAIPVWPHSRGWGYGPSGGLGLVLIIVVVLLLTGRLGSTTNSLSGPFNGSGLQI